jgi:hypothetical protein
VTIGGNFRSSSFFGALATQQEDPLIYGAVMTVFYYLLIPMAVCGAMTYLLELLWPKAEQSADEKDFGSKSRPAAKSMSDSAFVDSSDRSERIAREAVRKEERVEPHAFSTAGAADPMDAFQLPSDFDMAEFRSHHE